MLDRIKKALSAFKKFFDFILTFYYFYVLSIFLVFIHFFFPYKLLKPYISSLFNLSSSIRSQAKIWKAIHKTNNIYDFCRFFFYYVNNFYFSYLRPIFCFNFFYNFLLTYAYGMLPYSVIKFYEDEVKESQAYHSLCALVSLPLDLSNYILRLLHVFSSGHEPAFSNDSYFNKGRYSENPPPLIDISGSSGSHFPLDSNGSVNDYFFDNLSVSSAAASPSNYLYSKYNSNNLSSFSSTNSLNALDESAPLIQRSSINDFSDFSSSLNTPLHNITASASSSSSSAFQSQRASQSLKFSFSESDMIKSPSSPSVASKISSSSSYVFDSIFGVIPQETRDLWTDEKKKRKKLYNEIRDSEREHVMPPVRYKQ